MTFQDLVNLLLESLDERIQIISKQFDMPADKIKELNQYDPTGGKYLTWIVKQVKNNQLRFPEDGDKVKERLSQFQQLSKKATFKGIKDINQYKTYGNLAKTINDNLDVKTKGEIIRTAETKGVELLKEDGVYKLYLVTTAEAAAKLFRNTDWCVKDPKVFNDENYKPKQFYYVTKNNKPYSLLHINTRQHKDVNDADYSYERLPLLEPIVLKDPVAAADYAANVIGNRWSEAQPIILKDPEAAANYAANVIGNRWSEAEPIILKDPNIASFYARNVIKGRWSEAEPIILKDPEAAANYAANVIGNRWSEAEPIILKDPAIAVFYARNVIKGRWPEAEPIILKDPVVAANYAEHILKRRWPEAEPIILKNPNIAFFYARNVIKGRWPEAEKAALQNLVNLYIPWIINYCRFARKSRWREIEPFIKAEGYWKEYKSEIKSLDNFDQR